MVGIKGSVLLRPGDFVGALKFPPGCAGRFSARSEPAKRRRTLNGSQRSVRDGKLEPAQDYYQRSLKILPGDRRQARRRRALGNLATTSISLEISQPPSRNSKKACRPSGRWRPRGEAHPEQPWNVLSELGNLGGAKKNYEQAIAVSGTVGYKAQTALTRC